MPPPSQYHHNTPPVPYFLVTNALFPSHQSLLSSSLTPSLLPPAVGVSMGGMIAQSFALAYPADVLSLVLACTYAAPGPFCSRMFALWADMARSTGLAFVRRDTDLWCFTQRFYREREAELLQMEAAAQGVAQSVEAYLAQVSGCRVSFFQRRGDSGRGGVACSCGV